MTTLGILLLVVIVGSGFMFAYWAVQKTLKDDKKSRRKRTRSRR